MVYYHISKPRKQGNNYVVDIKEYQGINITRSTTILLKCLIPFIKGVFHEIPEEYEQLLKGENKV